MIETFQRDPLYESGSKSTKKEDDNFNIYVNQEKKVLLHKESEEDSEIVYQSDELGVEQDRSLMMSCTKMIEITDKYNIEHLATQSVQKQKAEDDFNAMDCLLEEELPNMSSFV